MVIRLNPDCNGTEVFVMIEQLSIHVFNEAGYGYRPACARYWRKYRRYFVTVKSGGVGDGGVKNLLFLSSTGRSSGLISGNEEL
jgi:hypothetical protein